MAFTASTKNTFTKVPFNTPEYFTWKARRQADKARITKPARQQPSPMMKPLPHRLTRTAATTSRESGLRAVLAVNTASYTMTERVRPPTSGANSRGSKAVTISRTAQMPRMVFEPVKDRTSCITNEAAWEELMAGALAEKKAREELMDESPADKRARREKERKEKLEKERAAIARA